MWSKKYNLKGCRECGTSERRHCGSGLCRSCYAKEQFKDPVKHARKLEQCSRSKAKRMLDPVKRARKME